MESGSAAWRGPNTPSKSRSSPGGANGGSAGALGALSILQDRRARGPLVAALLVVLCVALLISVGGARLFASATTASMLGIGSYVDAASPSRGNLLRQPQRHARWMQRMEAHYDKVREETFHRIFHTNTWGANETRAGPGSTIEYTANARTFLAGVIRELDIRTMVDLSCSEMNWQHMIDGFDGLTEFAGFDIVAETVERNRQRFAQLAPRVRFEERDMVRKPLSRAFDLVLVRDTLFHLPLSDVMTVLSSIEDSGSKYLATTYFTGMKGSNCFIEPGSWYAVDLLAPPFLLPPPIDETLEGVPGTDYYGSKRLGLWELPLSNKLSAASMAQQRARDIAMAQAQAEAREAMGSEEGSGPRRTDRGSLDDHRDRGRVRPFRPGQ
jgi:hypothetical protein